MAFLHPVQSMWANLPMYRHSGAQLFAWSK
jgi:hypothetical protein